MAGLFAGTSLERPVTCERCGRPHTECACPRDRKSGKVLDPRTQPIRIRREKRAGKVVTVIAGFTPRSDRTDDLPALLKQLRTTLGAGGTVAADSTAIEVQGDHRERVMEVLKGLGYSPKFAGG
jgi:translation initiation factor 1